MMDTNEFIRFHKLLMKNAPEGYNPFYFRCDKEGKNPYTKVGSWLKSPLTPKEAVGWLKEGGNVGIAGLNEDPLVLIDIDDETITDYKAFTPTLTTRSGSRRGVHLYYFENIIGSIPNIPTEGAGEIRANNQYVIAPGSYVAGYEDKVENVGKYTIEVDIPAAQIAFCDIPQVFKDQWGKVKEDDKEIDARKDMRQGKKTDGKKSALFDLSVYDIVGIAPNPNERFPSLVHESKTGKNTSINNGLIHCFRHQVTLNALQALAVLSGYLSCQEAGTGKKGSNAGQSLIIGDPRAIFEAWRYAKENGFIPESDPIPLRALGYIAYSEGFCRKEDIKDEWKIPIDAHNKALVYLGEKKIETGRNNLKTRKPKKEKQKHKEQQENDTAEILAMLKGKYRFITAEDTKTIYFYTDGVYEEADRRIEAEVERCLGETNSTYFTNEIINHLRRETYTSRDAFNTDKTRIPLKNGLFNIDTFALEHFDENKIFTFRFPVTYNADAKCPNIEKWIKEIVNEDSFDLLQEFCGYGFEPRFPLHKALWLHGSGRNGKGAFMRLYKKIIGRNASAVPLEQLNAKYRFSLVSLLNRFVNVCSEPQSNYVFQTETFKKVTGGDEIQGEIKGLQKKIDFTSFAKFFIMGNKYPTIEDDTTGFWDRMAIVKFPNDYSETFIDYIEDKKIEADGGDEKALAGFFNWCVAGLKRLKERKYKISESKSSEETRLEFEKVSNSIRAFITECVVLKITEKYPQPTLWNDYKNYCERFGLEIHQKSVFTTRIGEQRGVSLRPAKIEGKSQRAWFGLYFKGCDDEESTEINEKEEEENGLSKYTKLTNSHTQGSKEKNMYKRGTIEPCACTIKEYLQKSSTLSPLSPSDNGELSCTCGKRFDTVDVLRHHQSQCKEFIAKQDREAREKVEVQID